MKINTYIFTVIFVAYNCKNFKSHQEKNEITKYLPQHAIDDTKNLNYFLPYFVKARLLVFPGTPFPLIPIPTPKPNTNKLFNTDLILDQCTDPHCFRCNLLFPDTCLQCATGYFLKEISCEEVCPKGYISDVMRMRCVKQIFPTKNQNYNSLVISNKSYSIGSCANMCGKGVVDCSCSPSCKSSGSCCSDYVTHNCDRIFEMSMISKKDCENVKNCDMCDYKVFIGKANLKCNQCLENYYLFNGQCYKKCPEDTLPDDTNYICKKITSNFKIDYIGCNAQDCEACIEGTIDKCKECYRGTFLFDSQCLSRCPIGYRADRVTWSCLEYPSIYKS